MTKFTVRIELHGADDDDYENLHETMEEKGFFRWIEADGTKYRLPTAEYNFTSSTLDCGKVRDLAKSIAAGVKRSPTPWVLVTESVGRYWSGLEKWDE
jgi:hypothetical protein